ICGTAISLVSLIDDQRLWFKSRHGLDMAETRRDEGFCAHAILQDEPLVISDTASDPRFTRNPMAVGDSRVRFYAGAPLQTPNGYKLGTLCVMDRRPRELSPDQLAALDMLAHQAVGLLEMRKLVEDLALSNMRHTRTMREYAETHNRLTAVLNAATEVAII